MAKLRVYRRTNGEEWHENLPDLTVILKYEMAAGSFTQDEIVEICQRLIDSGHLSFFEHPLRRTCYDLALAGAVTGLQLPMEYMQLTIDPERVTHLHITAH